MNKLMLFLIAGLSAVGSTALAGVPGVAVTVSDHRGALVYRGTTDASGTFLTPRVASGDYVVQFNAKNAARERKDYAIFAAAGRQRVVADAVEGSKIAGAGVAMRLHVAATSPIAGQIVVGGLNALGTKIVNGRRYVLVTSETGTVGSRWVEEGSPASRGVSRVAFDDPTMIKPAPMLTAH